MKITISGYGKMGKEIETFALKNKHTISAILDKKEDWKAFQHKIVDSDVMIDFSEPDVVVSNIRQAFQLNIPIVVGTTGWDQHKEAVYQLCKIKEQALFVASNFSIGVNIFFEINTLLAKFMDQYPQYHPTIEEIHHTQKLDKPSGTAIELAKQILEQINRKSAYSLDSEIKPTDLMIASKRLEDTPGTHKVTYSSEEDQIEIKHTAHSRKGFASGAVMAAEWIIGKKGCYGMKDLLGIG